MMVKLIVNPQESEILSIIRYTVGAHRRSLGNYKSVGFFYSCPAIFEVPLYLIIDRISDSCGEQSEDESFRNVNKFVEIK